MPLMENACSLSLLSEMIKMNAGGGGENWERNLTNREKNYDIAENKRGSRTTLGLSKD